MKYETKRGGNKFQVVSMISQYDCGTSQLPTVPQLFLNRSSCKRKIRRADGHVWVLVKKVRRAQSTKHAIRRNLSFSKCSKQKQSPPGNNLFLMFLGGLFAIICHLASAPNRSSHPLEICRFGYFQGRSWRMLLLGHFQKQYLGQYLQHALFTASYVFNNTLNHS